MTKQTHKPNEAERRAKVDAIIDDSVMYRPANLSWLAHKTGEHRTLVWRRVNRKWEYRASGWEPREQVEDDGE